MRKIFSHWRLMVAIWLFLMGIVGWIALAVWAIVYAIRHKNGSNPFAFLGYNVTRVQS